MNRPLCEITVIPPNVEVVRKKSLAGSGSQLEIEIDEALRTVCNKKLLRIAQWMGVEDCEYRLFDFDWPLNYICVSGE